MRFPARKHRFLRLLPAALFCLSILFLGGCAGTAPSAEELRNVSIAVDYSKPFNWIVLPDADTPPREVDVFYVYPTIVAHKDHPYMDWSNPSVQEKAKNIAAQQTGVFSEVGMIYAPYYRQGEYFRVIAEAAEKPEKQVYTKTGTEDIRRAFRYYMEHYNKGRPFILFGHSQGAMVLLELMKSEFKDPKLRSKLVAAYLIGYPKMPKTFPDHPHLRLARGANDTGVIINYNSESPDAVKSIFTGPDSYCINPLNWRTDDVKADAAMNKGAVFFDGKNRIVSEDKNFCSAVVNPETGALIVVPAKKGTYDSELMGKGIYHMNDIYFFYRNLADNAKERVGAFWK